MRQIPIIAIVFMLLTTVSLAQENWAVELRPNVDFPMKEIGGVDLITGFGFEIAVNYSFMEHLGAYAGWGYNTFRSDTDGNQEETDFDETGYTFGLQFIHSIGTSDTFSYLVRAGGIYNHVEIENERGDITEDSGHRLGWEVGVGIQYDLGSAWLLRPQIGYRALSGDFDFEIGRVDFDLNYISVGVGIAKAF